jgi:glycosidase
MNYHSFAFPLKGYLMDGTSTPTECLRAIEEGRLALDLPRQGAMLNLVDSHDTDRVASMIVNGGRVPYRQPSRFDYDVSERSSPRHDPTYNVARPSAAHRRLQRLVALFQMTYPGSPMIYYGTEAGMWGGDDPDDRMPMVWPDIQYANQAAHPLAEATRTADPVAFDRELHQFYRSLIRLRQDQPVLRRGDFQLVLTDDAQQSLVFSRSSAENRLYVVLNRSTREARLVCPWDAPGPNAPQLKLVFSSNPVVAAPGAEIDSGRLALHVPAETGLIYQLTRREL